MGNLVEVKSVEEAISRFYQFASTYRFKATRPRYDVPRLNSIQEKEIGWKWLSDRTKYFIGFTWSILPEMMNVEYNDFTFSEITTGELSWESGKHGGYRPEGYACGGWGSDEKIIARLLQIISEFKKRHTGIELYVSRSSILFIEK